jgi:hypothetical protein
MEIYFGAGAGVHQNGDGQRYGCVPFKYRNLLLNAAIDYAKILFVQVGNNGTLPIAHGNQQARQIHFGGKKRTLGLAGW